MNFSEAISLEELTTIIKDLITARGIDDTTDEFSSGLLLGLEVGYNIGTNKYSNLNKDTTDEIASTNVTDPVCSISDSDPSGCSA